MSLTFDTLAYAKRLKEADIPEAQAEAQAEALRAALDTQELVTRKDLEIALGPIRVMLGAVLAGIVALLARAFF